MTIMSAEKDLIKRQERERERENDRNRNTICLTGRQSEVKDTRMYIDQQHTAQRTGNI